MITIGELTSEDVQKYQPIFQACYELFQSVNGVYYKINIDGEEKILHRVENLFTIFELDENVVGYQMFTVDDNYQVADVAFDDYEMHPQGNRRVFQRREDGMTECLDFFERPNGPDNEGYNGMICYVQYNPTNDMRVMIMYQQNIYNNKTKIYEFHTRVPFQIKIEKHVLLRDKGVKLPFCSKTYIKRTFDYRDEPLFYTLATLKDYGVGATIGQDVVSLQGSNDITRYYRELFITKNYQAISLFPFCNQYKIEEIKEYLESLGFNTSIPKLLVDYHNNELPEIRTYQELSDLLKPIEETQDYTNGSPVVLKFTMDGEEIQDGEDN